MLLHRQAVKRAENHMSAAQLEGGDLGRDGAEFGLEDPEFGRMDRTYPVSLERESFVGSSAAGSPNLQKQFELKAVGGSGKAIEGADPEKSSLLALTAASGSGSIQAQLAAAEAGPPPSL
jgi:hypothetical protein